MHASRPGSVQVLPATLLPALPAYETTNLLTTTTWPSPAHCGNVVTTLTVRFFPLVQCGPITPAVNKWRHFFTLRR
jgi:hypothetical protein